MQPHILNNWIFWILVVVRWWISQGDVKMKRVFKKTTRFGQVNWKI